MDDWEIIYDCHDGCGPETEGFGGWLARESGGSTDAIGEGVREIRADDGEYPEALRTCLGDAAPGELSCAGETALLGEPCVMVCGAREASEEALGLAYRCGRVIADAGFVLASGYARGVDMAAHRGALDSGGSTVAFLPYGLMRFRVHRGLREAFDPERFLAVSELGPWQVFTPRSALRRNAMLAALARAVIVVEPGETGGTWYSAEQAHRMGKPLYYLEGARPQVIARMESLGGVRLRVRKGAPELGAALGDG